MTRRPDDDPLSLSVPEVAAEVAETLAEGAGDGAGEGGEDADLAALADDFVSRVLGGEVDAGPQAQAQRRAVDRMGAELQEQSAYRSAMLREPIRALAHRGEDGGPVAQALTDLKAQMEGLDPGRRTFSTGRLARLFSFLPGVGTTVTRYFTQFESAQEVLDAIIKSLESGRDTLERDNVTLSTDQQVLGELLVQVRRQVALGKAIDRRLAAAAGALPEDSPRRRFIEEELLFPLRQRIMDLHQQAAVNQQGVLALELVIRNNRELARGVDRAVTVTVSALNVAVTVALALANQRLVLERVEALNATTSALVSGTAARLRGQGQAIQQRAASSMLEMEQLEAAFRDVLAAIDEIGRYRREALPRLDQQIDRLDGLTKEGAAAIKRLEDGRAADAGQAAPEGG
jgi:uncharacterized protein YaaN involved in tellurite resistance